MLMAEYEVGNTLLIRLQDRPLHSLVSIKQYNVL
jgi:hypothetical protein